MPPRGNGYANETSATGRLLNDDLLRLTSAMLTSGIVRCFNFIVNVSKNGAICHDIGRCFWSAPGCLPSAQLTWQSHVGRCYNCALCPHYSPSPLNSKHG